MAKAFWRGSITFGMVSIPVRMYVATVSRAISFHLLHKKCLTRPKQLLYCQQDNEYFTSKETVRGYEYARDQYVVFRDSDFEKVPVRTTHAIDMVAFVKAEEIDPIYYSGSHYLEPEELGVKPFLLLREALRRSQRVGIAKVAFQRREHLCCLRPYDNILVLQTMHYAHEVLPAKDIDVPEKEVADAEVEMAGKLIDVMVRKFKPAEYRDEYSRALEEIVRAKVQGEEVKVTALPKLEEMPDLMAALRASIEAASKESATRPQGRAAGGSRRSRR